MVPPGRDDAECDFITGRSHLAITDISQVERLLLDHLRQFPGNPWHAVCSQCRKIATPFAQCGLKETHTKLGDKNKPDFFDLKAPPTLVRFAL